MTFGGLILSQKTVTEPLANFSNGLVNSMFWVVVNDLSSSSMVVFRFTLLSRYFEMVLASDSKGLLGFVCPPESTTTSISFLLTKEAKLSKYLL